MSAHFRFHAICHSKWIAFCLSFAVFAAVTRDWPQYRGPNHDGVSTDRISKQWTGSVTNALWRVFLGNGLTGLTASGGRVLTQVHRDVDGADMEVCVALNATTGVELWAMPVDDIVAYDGGVGTTDDGPRTTPTVDGGSVYVLTSSLKLLRLNAANGAVLWSNDLRVTYGGEVIRWQNTASPVVDNGLIYLNVNAGGANLMALQASDGSLFWRSQDESLTHSTPVLTTMNGARQLIFATQSGLVSVDPQTGNLLWRTSYPIGYNGLALGASPAVYSNLVFITAFYSQGSAAFEILYTNATHVPRLLWSSTAHQSHWSTPVCYQGCLFGQFTPDNANAQLRCLDLRTGALKWATNNFGRGSVLLVNDHLLVITERGSLVLAKPNTNAYTEVARFLAMPDFHTDTNKCWNAPAVADGKVYVRSTSYATAFDLSVPDLQLDLPQLVPPDKLQLTIRAANGTPVDSNRVPLMELLASTDLTLSLDQWPKLTNTFTLTNGIVRVNNVDATPPPRFFIVSEPK
jgi:outer membrane protein assembly factor BamB